MPPFLLALLPELLKAGREIIERTIPDKDAAAKAAAALEEKFSDQDFQVRLAQIAVNAKEAENQNWFVAGWRPAVGWIGAFAFGYAAIVEPLARFIANVFFHYSGTFPVLDSTITMQVLFGLLGLGVYRTLEKVKNAEGNR